mgnify:FL=1
MHMPHTDDFVLFCFKINKIHKLMGFEDTACHFRSYVIHVSSDY